MPTVNATPLPNAGIVQVDVDARDIAAIWIRLERVMVDTGEVTIVRPHTSYDGDYMQTSNRLARFFDSDAPTDRTFYYQVRALGDPDTVWPGVITANAVSVVDTFTRTVGAGATWGNPDVGQAWNAQGTTTEASVAAGEGTLTLGAENVLRGQKMHNSIQRNQWDVTYLVGVDAIPTGDSHLVHTYQRANAALTDYIAFTLHFRTTTEVWYSAAKSVGGVATNLIGTTDALFNFDVNTGVNVRMQTVGNYARYKLWGQNQTEPAAWLAEVFIPDVQAVGQSSIVAFLPTPQTNVLPVVFDFDNVRAAGATPGEATQYMLSSEGTGWLRDPINPCHNVRLSTCIDASRCAVAGLTFEMGSASGWQGLNGTVTAQTAQRFRGEYAGALTVDYTDPATGVGTPLPTTYYTFDATAEGWAGEGATSVARVTSPTPHDGAGMLQATKTMGAGFDSVRFNDNSGQPDDISGNGPTLGIWALVPAGAAGTNWQAHIEVQNSSFTWIPGTDVAMTPGTWRLLTFTPPAGLLANSRAIGVQFSANGVGGSQAVYIDTVRQGGQPAALSSQSLAVAPGRAVRAGAWLMTTSAFSARVGINWYRADGSWISTSSGPYVTLAANVWTLSTMVAEAPAGAATAKIEIMRFGTPPAGGVLYFDAAYLRYREPSTNQVFFAALDSVHRAVQSQTIAVINDSLPVNVSLPRRAPDGAITVVTRSFEDRDALNLLLAGGTPVQLDMPEVYGIPAMTMAVGDTDEGRGLPDHRYQPRVHNMPYQQVRPQVGPANGPCGAKYEDWCEDPNLDTWAEVNAAALTYNAMIDVT